MTNIRSELVMVGTELLLGETVDTNATYLAQCLSELGIGLYFKTTVGDNWLRMSSVLATSLTRSHLVIVSGGLGPTQDDLTKDVVAAVTRHPLVLDEQAWEHIQALLRHRGRPITENNKRQAMLPEGARSIPNPVGVAPGVWLDLGERLIICLPGVPDELRTMVDRSVKPWLAERFPTMPLQSRVLRFRGIGESALSAELEDLIAGQSTPTIALYAGSGEVRIRLTCRAASEKDAESIFSPVESEIRRRVGSKLYAVGTAPIEQLVGERLRRSGERLAIAESCTGGLIGGRVTSVPGASAYFLGGVIAYANTVKQGVLGVEASLLAKHGAVSAEVALAMADGVRELMGADWGLGVTGIAGPDGGSEEKPVGTVFIAVTGVERRLCRHYLFSGDREMIRRRATEEALHLLFEALGSDRA